jgi:hypothetical protein
MLAMTPDRRLELSEQTWRYEFIREIRVEMLLDGICAGD